MGFDIILARFLGANFGIALLAFVVSCCFKKREHKAISAIFMFVICYFGRYGGQGDYMIKSLHIGDVCAAEILSWLIIISAILLIRGIFKAIKVINKGYIEPLQEAHNDKREEYRKYLINCDKKGKHPLSYNQWKFAYNGKNKTSTKNKKKEAATTKHKKTYGWQSWE